MPARRTFGRIASAGVLALALFAFAGFPHAVGAATTETFTLDPGVGKTYTVDNDRFGVRAGTLDAAATFTVTVGSELPAKPPAGWTVAGNGVAYSFVRADGTVSTLGLDLWVDLPYDEREANRSVSIWSYDAASKRWQQLPTRVNRTDRRAKLSTRLASATLVVLESDYAYEGVASWYRSSKYPNGAAFNGAPFGAKLLVTNLDTGKSTTVSVVSSGPFVRSRVIDLTHTAFSRLASRSSGLFRAKVKVLTPAVAGATVRVGAPAPIGSPTAVVYDPAAKTVLWEKGSDAARPIASITKLVAAAVFLDTGTSMDKIVTYSSSDGATCSCLRVSPGETLRARDLFSAALVGSANNATNALARSTGLTRAEFVRRMNEKGKAWGLTTARFTDPTGLEATNVASAHDVAVLVTKAFEDDRIASATRKTSYSFTTLNTKVAHTVKNRNTLLTQPFAVVGTKTGYLEESGYCLVALATTKGGNGSIVTVILGSATDRQRYDDTAKLLTWAL